MKIVKYRWVILEKRMHLVASQSQRETETITIVVVGNVLTPENKTRSRFSSICFAVVVKIYHPISAINFECGSDHHDHVLAYRFYERRIFDRKAIRHLH